MANEYVSLAEFKDRMGITDEARDYSLGRILTSASRWVDHTTGRRFYTLGTPETRFYTADRCTWEIEIDDALSITEVAIDRNGDGTYDATMTVGVDYRLDPVNAPAHGRPYTRLTKVWYASSLYFPTYDYGVRVTSSHFGYCTLANVPPDIRELTMMVAELMARPILDMGMAGVQTYRLGQEISVSMKSEALPQMARQIVHQYQPGGGLVY